MLKDFKIHVQSLSHCCAHAPLVNLLRNTFTSTWPNLRALHGLPRQTVFFRTRGTEPPQTAPPRQPWHNRPHLKQGTWSRKLILLLYLIFHNMCIFDRRKLGYAFIHSTDKKMVYILAILPTAAYVSKKSDAIGVPHSSTPRLPPPPSVNTFLHTRKQTNVVS